MKEVVDLLDRQVEAMDKEIADLEAQLDQRQERRNRIDGLREQAAALDGDGGGMAPVAEKPASPKAKRPKPVASEDYEQKVLDALRTTGPRARKSAIQRESGLSGGTLNRTLLGLRESGKVVTEGQRAGTRYSLEGSDRPKSAPTQTERPAPAPTPAPAPPRASRGSQVCKCGERLRKPHPTGLCGFCLEERGLKTAEAPAEAPAPAVAA